MLERTPTSSVSAIHIPPDPSANPDHSWSSTGGCHFAKRLSILAWSTSEPLLIFQVIRNRIIPPMHQAFGGCIDSTRLQGNANPRMEKLSRLADDGFSAASVVTFRGNAGQLLLAGKQMTLDINPR
jgi:hypothetical protein